MKKPLLALVLAATLLLSGCSALLESERLVITPYEGDKSAGSGSTGTEISDYAALRAAIKWLVDNHEEHGEYTFPNYEGDAREDLFRAIEDVKSNTALGAYSVEYMTPDSKRIVSYFRAELSITYKRTKQEVDDIISLEGGIAALSDAVGEMLGSADTYKAFRIIASAARASEIEAQLRDIYLDYSFDCPVRPEVAVGVSPETGIEKIIEVTLDYGYAREELVSFRDELTRGLADFAELKNEEDEALRVISAASQLAERCRPYSPGELISGEFLPVPPANTAVSAVSRGTADSEGFAMAFYAILNYLGMECEVVSGALDREPHFWNIVGIGGHSYHFDVSRFSAEEPQETCLRSDADMSGRYFWDAEGYPVCDGALSYAELFPEETETPDA